MAPLLAGSVGRMTDRVGTRLLTSGSMLLAAVAIAAVWLLADHRSVGLLLPAFLAFGVARPIATVELGPEPFKVRARVAKPEERDELAKAVPYLAQQQTLTKREIPIVVLERS